MVNSELLEEKYRVQRKLSQKALSVHDYLRRSSLAAQAIAPSYGFPLQYLKLEKKNL